MTKKVAICMATYNAADYLREMLWSIENQTYKDYTVYIFNDGSEDDTKEVIEEYAKKIPIKVKHSEGVHVIGTVKNYVVNMALKDNPKYIQMTDSDDLLEPTMLERMVWEMEDTGADFAICDGSTFGDETYNIKNDLNEEIGAEMAEALIERENPFFSWAMFKADVLREQNYRVGMKYFEDWDLYIRLLKAKKKFSIVRESLYNYRTHAGQFHKVTNKDFDKHKRSLWEINNIGDIE